MNQWGYIFNLIDLFYKKIAVRMNKPLLQKNKEHQNPLIDRNGGRGKLIAWLYDLKIERSKHIYFTTVKMNMFLLLLKLRTLS